MFYVYYLRSISNSKKTYIGFTQDLTKRLECHNTGKSIYTSKYMPWEIIGYLAFNSEEKARSFENYLKTNAGKIFLSRYMI